MARQQGIRGTNQANGKGGTQKLGDFEVTMTHAFHSNSIDDNGERIYGGEPAGLVIRMPGGFTVYHAGDTALFSDMKLIGELYKPDVALLRSATVSPWGRARQRMQSGFWA